ncbi:MAG: hypothetical protein U1F30_04865 [Steroidobacteraceae bacterium]
MQIQVLATSTGRFRRRTRAMTTASSVWTGSGTKAMATPAPKAAVMLPRFSDQSPGSVMRPPKTRKYQRWRRRWTVSAMRLMVRRGIGKPL